MPAADPHLNSIRAKARAAAEAEQRLAASVQEARRHGVTWADIGDALGITRQAAFKRFGRPVDPETGASIPLAPSAPVLARTEDVIRLLASGDVDAVRGMMTWTCARELSRSRLTALWRDVLALVGEWESSSGHEVRSLDGELLQQPDANNPQQTAELPAIGRVVLHHEAGDLVAHVAWSRDDKLAGVAIAPPAAESSMPF